MTSKDKSSPEFFDAKYRADADPWNFASSPYELQRYDAIFVALAHRRYRLAVEPGCSIGVLTRRLASICDAVEASDFSPTAAAKAREYCTDLENVWVLCRSLAEISSLEEVDLLVLSEVGYYFDFDHWRTQSHRLITQLPSGATVLGCHWLGNSADHCISGDEVHAVLDSSPLLRLEHSKRHLKFRLDRWLRQ